MIPMKSIIVLTRKQWKPSVSTLNTNFGTVIVSAGITKIFTGLRKIATEIICLTQEDVMKMKPDPECYLKAMDYFKVKPEDTIIFEDSDAGLEAAAKSGAFYYKVFRLNDISVTT